MLEDETMLEGARSLITNELINAEWALTIQLEEVCRQFQAIDDEYLREACGDGHAGPSGWASRAPGHAALDRLQAGGSTNGSTNGSAVISPDEQVAAGSRGQVTTLLEGPAQLSATVGGITGVATLNNTGSPLMLLSSENVRLMVL